MVWKSAAFVLALVLGLAFLTPRLELLAWGLERFGPRFNVGVYAEEAGGVVAPSLKRATIVYDGTSVATVADTRLWLWLGYNRVTLSGITLQGVAGSLLPANVESVRIEHHLLSPLQIRFEALGDFGALHGRIDLNASLKPEVRADLSPSPLMQQYRYILRQGEEREGVYRFVWPPQEATEAGSP